MTRRTKLLATVGAGALTAATMASQAMAFEVVDWDWTKTVTSTENITVNTNVTINFDGLVEIEKWQLFFGNLSSVATVSGVSNNPPTGTGTSGPQNAIVDGTLLYTPSDGGSVNPLDAGQTLASSNPNIHIGTISGNVDENQNDESGKGEIDLRFTVTVDPTNGASIPAIDLPSVHNSATSVANNQVITTTTALQLHDLQIAAGSINSLDGREPGDPNALAFVLGALGLFQIDNQLDGINEQYDMAALVILGAATGFVNPANISSTATVSGILNASVANSATSVGNNAAYTINASIPGNAYMIADLTQLTIANVSSTATVSGVTVNNYTGFGSAGFGNLSDPSTPLVSNSATSVGNNLVINVDGCTLCTTVGVVR
jgi:hypothetical protein